MSQGERTRAETLASIEECRVVHDVPTYFQMAEPYMREQWDAVIDPLIREADFTTVLELAPGHGRNTAQLVKLARDIHLLDVTQSCLDACRARFGERQGECRLHYHRNDGLTMPSIGDRSISFIYSWDAAVHFDKEVLQSYIREFARVLQPHGTGFVHHSNYGEVAPNSSWRTNPAWRSDMTKALFEQYCREAGLRLTQQRLLPWGEVTDCLSLFRRDDP